MVYFLNLKNKKHYSPRYAQNKQASGREGPEDSYMHYETELSVSPLRGLFSFKLSGLIQLIVLVYSVEPSKAVLQMNLSS